MDPYKEKLVASRYCSVRLLMALVMIQGLPDGDGWSEVGVGCDSMVVIGAASAPRRL